MTKQQTERLQAAIDAHNATAGNKIHWWDVLNEIGFENLGDEKAVDDAIAKIESGNAGRLNVVIYARGADAQKQIATCENYAAAYNMNVCGIITDADELNRRITDGGIDAVIVTHASRISRKMDEFIKTKNTFADHGTEIISIA